MLGSRPLTTEPLALDLVNTRWRDAGGEHDLLTSEAATVGWLDEHGLTGPAASLREARAAILAALEGGDRLALDTILARGRVRLLADGGEEIEVEERSRAAWLAARDLRRLLTERPSRVRRCAAPGCVLWFEDLTRPGTRRWCSMATCGNRHKGRRHHARQRGD